MRSFKLAFLGVLLSVGVACAGYLPLLKAGVGGLPGQIFSADFTSSTIPAEGTFTATGLGTYYDAGGLTFRPNNLLLNTAMLSTQNVTTVAYSYILSFKGTGSVTLSGTSTSGPLNGTGVGDRVYLKFTPTAGTLTLTVSGTVTEAQLEAVTYQTTPRTYVATTGSAYYGPRFQSINGGTTRLLLEAEARTNLMLQSGNLASAEYLVGSATLSTDGTLFLDGTAAQKLTATAANLQHQIYNSTGATITGGVTRTLSLYAKSGTNNYLELVHGGDTSGEWFAAIFDLSGTTDAAATKTAAGASGSIISATSKYVGNGWFRLQITGSITGTNSYFWADISPSGSATIQSAWGDVIFNAAGTESVYVAAPQMEIGVSSSSFIYTTSASVTRVAESLSFDLSALSFPTNEITIVAKHSTSYGLNNFGNQPEYYVLDDGTGGAPNRLTSDGWRNASDQMANSVGFTDNSIYIFTPTATDGAVIKYALSIKNGAQALSINGSDPLTNATAKNTTMPVRAILNAYDVGVGYENNGEWETLAIYDKAYSGTALQTLSTP